MKFIIGFLIAIGLLVFVFVLIFRGGGSHATTTTPVQLVDYANTDTTMQMTIEGPVIANQTHKAVQINVGDTETTINVLSGYQDDVVQSKTYPSNSTAYADFLKGLQLAGYTLVSKDKNQADDRGRCSLGQRYIYTIEDGANEKQRSWSSSCKSGNFLGNTTIVNTLFEDQIPDYATITNGVFQQ